MRVFRRALEWMKRHEDEDDETETTATVRKVFYPGCHRHLTAALVFPDVTFVDRDSEVAPLYEEAAAHEYVEANKIYSQDARYRFILHDVERSMDDLLERNSFHLLISLSAGLLVRPCTPYVMTTSPSSHGGGGHLLVNDSHGDARAAFVSGDCWDLRAHWDDETRDFTDAKPDQCFRVYEKTRSQETAVPISVAQVEESVAVGTVSKRSFKKIFEPRFFLFQKKALVNEYKQRFRTNSDTRGKERLYRRCYCKTREAAVRTEQSMRVPCEKRWMNRRECGGCESNGTPDYLVANDEFTIKLHHGARQETTIDCKLRWLYIFLRSFLRFKIPHQCFC